MSKVVPVKNSADGGTIQVKCSPNGRPQRRLPKSSMTLFWAQDTIAERLTSEQSTRQRRRQGTVAVTALAVPLNALTYEGNNGEVTTDESLLVAKSIDQPARDEDADNDAAVGRLAQLGLPWCTDLVGVRLLVPLAIVL